MWTLFLVAVDIVLLSVTQDLGLDYLEEVHKSHHQGGGKWRTLTTWDMDTVKFTQSDQHPRGCVELVKQNQHHEHVNLMWYSDVGWGTQDKDEFFRIQVKSGNPLVGITNELFFGQGWKIKGFFYGGSLSDGKDRLLGNFGPPIREGDDVDVKVSVTYTIRGRQKNQRINTEYTVNKKYVGTVYSVAVDSRWWSWNVNNEAPEKKLRPTVILQTIGDKVCYRDISEAEFSGGWVPHAEDDVAGDWVTEDEDNPVYLRLMATDSPNNFYVSYRVYGGNEKFGPLYKDENGEWIAGLFLTTFVAVEQKYFEREQEMEELFSKLSKVERTGNNLLLSFGSTTMKFKPQYNFDKGRSPLEIDNVEWPTVPKQRTEF